MATKRTGLRKSTLAALVLLPPIIGLVIYNSFQVSQFQCTVCIDFDGHSDCRTVTGHTKAEGLQSATNNVCALLTSGMTDSIRCSRTAPTKAECLELAGGDSSPPKAVAF